MINYDTCYRNPCNNRWPWPQPGTGNCGCSNNWYGAQCPWYPGQNRPPMPPWPPMNNGCRPPVPPCGNTPDAPDYGGRLNTTAQTLTLPANTPTAVPLPVTLPNEGVTYLNPNAVTIADAGDYEVFYMLGNGEVTETATLTLQLRNNGVPVANTAVNSTDATSIVGSTILTLAAGDVLDLIVTANGAVPLALGTGTTAALIAKQLG